MLSFSVHSRHILLHSSSSSFRSSIGIRYPNFLPLLFTTNTLFKSHYSSSSSSFFLNNNSRKKMGSLSVFDETIQYPIAHRDDSVIDNYHGVNVPDPYRWLENPDAEEVKEFVQKQVVLTDSVLKTCDCRAKLGETIKKVFDHPRYSAPFKRGANHYFYFHNTGLQPQSVLYVQVTYFLIYCFCFK
jgi:prolyl oligopeptidase